MKYKAGSRGLRHRDIYGGTKIWNAGEEVPGAASFKDIKELLKSGKLVEDKPGPKKETETKSEPKKGKK